MNQHPYLEDASAFAIGDPARLQLALVVRADIREQIFDQVHILPLLFIEIGDSFWCFGYDAIIASQVLPPQQCGEAVINVGPGDKAINIPVAFGFVTGPILDDTMRALIKIASGPGVTAAFHRSGHVVVYTRNDVEGVETTPLMPKPEKGSLQA